VGSKNGDKKKQRKKEQDRRLICWLVEKSSNMGWIQKISAEERTPISILPADVAFVPLVKRVADLTQNFQWQKKHKDHEDPKERQWLYNWVASIIMNFHSQSLSSSFLPLSTV